MEHKMVTPGWATKDGGRTSTLDRPTSYTARRSRPVEIEYGPPVGFGGRSAVQTRPAATPPPVRSTPGPAMLTERKTLTPGEVLYLVVSERIVDPIALQAAQFVVWKSAEALELGEVGIRWYAKASDRERDYFDRYGPDGLEFFTDESHNAGIVFRSDPGHVWLDVTLSKWLATETAAHECRHLWQFKHWPPSQDDRATAEADANDYARQVVAWCEAQYGRD